MASVKIEESKVLRNHFYEQLLVIKPIISKLNHYIEPTSAPTMVTPAEFMDTQFADHTKYLMKREIITPINTMLNKYYEWVSYNPSISQKMTPRMFLTAWTVISFPECVLDKTKEQLVLEMDYRTNVYISAVSLINTVNELIVDSTPTNFMSFISNINKYSNTFTSFLQHDKIVKINDLARQWIDLGKNIKLIQDSSAYDDYSREKTLVELNNTRKSIEKFIKQLSPSFDLNDLVKAEILVENTSIAMLKAYSDIIYDELTKKTYSMATKLLEDIKNTFVLINNKLKDELNDKIDTELLLQRHKNNSITINEVLHLGEYMVSLIKTLESSSAEPTTIAKWDKIKETPYTDINLVIIDVFMFVINELEDIKLNLINIKVLVSLGINPFV